MNKYIIFLIFPLFLKAEIINDFLNKNYEKICKYTNIEKFAKNPKILTVIGKSCIEIDNIYLLPTIITKLKRSKVERKNALYFLILIMEKRLIYSFLFDNISIESFSFPKIDYVLSDIFWALKEKKYKIKNGIYIIKLKNKIYKLYKKEDKMFLDEYEKNRLVKRRWYR